MWIAGLLLALTLQECKYGVEYIRTANDDKDSTGTNFLSFDINADAMVYVAHDPRILIKPMWLSSWTDTGMSLDTTDGPRRIYEKWHTKGRVTLGGNVNSSGEGTCCSMYSVIVQPVCVPPDNLLADTTPPPAPTITVVVP